MLLQKKENNEVPIEFSEYLSQDLKPFANFLTHKLVKVDKEKVQEHIHAYK